MFPVGTGEFSALANLRPQGAASEHSARAPSSGSSISSSEPDSPAPPTWRRDPYRILFPLGIALAWAGVLHWFLHGLGVLEDYRPVFHAIAQIQGFMICFALGFLMTAIPRRTGTAAPAAWEMVVAIVAPVGTTVSAWFGRFALSQVFWFVLVITLIAFVVRRFVSAGAVRRPPVGFVWIPLSFLMGLAGSVLISAYGILGEDYYHLHELGRLYLLQGLFVGLVVGIGGMVLPLITRGESSSDLGSSPGDLWRVAGHLLLAVVLAASFWIESAISLRGGIALRAAVVLLLLILTGGILRFPTMPGWHRRLVWLSAWMIPAGYVLAAVFPAQKKAGLHVVFIGGLAMMALSVGLHVTLAHSGTAKLVRGRPWQVPVYGGLLLLAMGMRVLVDFDRERFFAWIAASAALFLMASLAWASLALPLLWSSPARSEDA